RISLWVALSQSFTTLVQRIRGMNGLVHWLHWINPLIPQIRCTKVIRHHQNLKFCHKHRRMRLLCRSRFYWNAHNRFKINRVTY
ncbi:MAG: hypothetical protein VSS75_001570, partial [Candidatus Parabeggiatoa sp.]|nr:hypothetical protein [Candidatus Parabeggiatoa sp.]